MPEKNNEEMTAEEYDNYFAERRKKKTRKTRMKNQMKRSKLYKTAAKFLSGSKAVIELGCGDGILTKFLDEGIDYVGIDFAKSQIEMAKKYYPDRTFILADVKKWVMRSNEYSYACLEVLEHIKDDLSVVEKIPKGARFVFSVPSASSAYTHVRYFESFDEIYDRYGEYLIFQDKDEMQTSHGNVVRIIKSRRNDV
jgi:2-polyprenyl-3-methyl-5-hydroxy-6-metoxy-1,4-benzoquinol methylase